MFVLYRTAAKNYRINTWFQSNWRKHFQSQYDRPADTFKSHRATIYYVTFMIKKQRFSNSTFNADKKKWKPTTGDRKENKQNHCSTILPLLKNTNQIREWERRKRNKTHHFRSFLFSPLILFSQSVYAVAHCFHCFNRTKFAWVV